MCNNLQRWIYRTLLFWSKIILSVPISCFFTVSRHLSLKAFCPFFRISVISAPCLPLIFQLSGLFLVTHLSSSLPPSCSFSSQLEITLFFTNWRFATDVVVFDEKAARVSNFGLYQISAALPPSYGDHSIIPAGTYQIKVCKIVLNINVSFVVASFLGAFMVLLQDAHLILHQLIVWAKRCLPESEHVNKSVLLALVG